MTTLLSTTALAYGHPNRTLGRDVSLDLHAGEVVCVLGPNGGGKTTLFRTFLGLIATHSGEIRLAGDLLAGLSASERARRVAYVPQAGNSYFAFTVRDVVLMGRTAHLDLFAAPGEPDLAAADAAMQEMRIGHLAEKLFTQISGGERQLALIARALAQGAPLLVMDEPTASLDFGNQMLILGEIRCLKAGGRSVLFCSHDPDHALQCADRAVLLHQGGIVASGMPREVITPANLKTLYGIDVQLIDDPQSGRRFCRPVAPQDMRRDAS